MDFKDFRENYFEISDVNDDYSDFLELGVQFPCIEF